MRYRIAFAIALALGSSSQRAAATEFIREEMRIPMPAAGPRGLEALLVRTDEGGRHPLVLINHGAPRQDSERPQMTPLGNYLQAIEFVRRGWIAAMVMRRNFGDSGGSFAEDKGPCADPDYIRAGVAAAADLKTTIAYLAKRPDIDASRILSVGVSAGGFATVALTADPPAGLVAGVSFAGGRGSDKPDTVCREDHLIGAFAEFGKRSRLPMLWVYAENDHFFGPALADKFHDAFIHAGGRATLVKAPAFGVDGHSLFSAAGIPKWTPPVDDFLKAHNLALRAELLPPPAPPKIPPPPRLSADGRQVFMNFLAAAPHKAFAVSENGAYGFASALRTIDAAKTAALGNCPIEDGCRLVVVDDAPVPAP